ncbi:hypothetical protein LINPERHAP1_LOCUS64 [Linum perenne]
MLRRKPTKIEVTIDDKDELEEARRPSSVAVASASTTATTSAASSLANLLDRTQPTSKSQRISLTS